MKLLYAAGAAAMLAALLGAGAAAHAQQAQKKVEHNTYASVTGPQVVVYKTRKDYCKYVPVTLSDDKTKIVSYPDPADLRKGKRFTTPTRLHKGYLLDNRGIGKNVAFLNITYLQYTVNPLPVNIDEMYKKILDKDPLVEIYDCGVRDAKNNSVRELNSLIDRKMLHGKCQVME